MDGKLTMNDWPMFIIILLIFGLVCFSIRLIHKFLSYKKRKVLVPKNQIAVIGRKIPGQIIFVPIKIVNSDMNGQEYYRPFIEEIRFYPKTYEFVFSISIYTFTSKAEHRRFDFFITAKVNLALPVGRIFASSVPSIVFLNTHPLKRWETLKNQLKEKNQVLVSFNIDGFKHPVIQQKIMEDIATFFKTISMEVTELSLKLRETEGQILD